MLLGRGRFTADISRGGTLHAAFARSPHAAAALGHIDLSAALAVPGVVAACTAADLGQPALLAVLDRPEFVPTELPLLATGQVRHVGEPVAIVVADDPYTAEDAAELVAVDVHPAAASGQPGRRPRGRRPPGARWAGRQLPGRSDHVRR